MRSKMQDWEVVAPHVPTLTLPTAKPGVTRTFAWVGPMVLHAAAATSLASAVAASPYSDLQPSDFHPAEHVLARLRARAGLQRGMWQQHLKAPKCHVPVLYALGAVSGKLRQVRYVHVPVHVYDATDVRTVKEWLVRDYAPPKLERRARRALRARVAAERARYVNGGPVAEAPGLERPGADAADR